MADPAAAWVRSAVASGVIRAAAPLMHTTRSPGCRDVTIKPWEVAEGEHDRQREVAFTARIHDPPIGSSRTVKVVAHQRARMHSDGTFSADFHNVRPSRPPPVRVSRP